MADKLMYIPNDDTQIIPFLDYNYWLKHLDTESTNQNSLKVPNVVTPTNKKTILKTLGTRVINSPLSPPSLIFI